MGIRFATFDSVDFTRTSVAGTWFRGVEFNRVNGSFLIAGIDESYPYLDGDDPSSGWFPTTAAPTVTFDSCQSSASVFGFGISESERLLAKDGNPGMHQRGLRPPVAEFIQSSTVAASLSGSRVVIEVHGDTLRAVDTALVNHLRQISPDSADIRRDGAR